MSVFHQKPDYVFVKVDGRFVRIDRDRLSWVRRMWRRYNPTAFMLLAIVVITALGLYALAWLTRGPGR